MTDSVPRTEADWIKAYEEKGALWMHSGNSADPHALLTSGKHSNGFFNSRLVSGDEELLRQAALALGMLFAAEDWEWDRIRYVVGPQTGATKLAVQIAAVIHRHTKNCDWMSPAKGERDGVKTMELTPIEVNLLHGQHVLICEDVITTGGSVERTVDAAEGAGATVLPYILALVNRSGLTHVGDRRILALIDRPLPIWEADDCPLCQEGSVAVRPKDNWALLTGRTT